MRQFVLIIAGITWLAGIGLAAPTNQSAAAQEDAIWSDHVLKAYQSIQDQHSNTLRAVQQAREEAAAETKRQAEALQLRLQHLEQTVVDNANEQRAREARAAENSRRFTLAVAGLAVAVGLLVVLVVGVAIVRVVNRRTAPLRVHPVNGSVALGELPAGGNGLAALDPAQQSTARLRASLASLDQRLNELESNAGPTTAELPATSAPTPLDALDPQAARAALLLGKGQALLNQQQVAAALECFEEAVTLDPGNAEGFLRKGTALEKLEKLDEAIECYDRAIALDDTLTMAYLCKGGVFNRQERYSDAVECYEQALRSQRADSGA